MLTSLCSVYENLNRDEAKIGQATSVGILTVNHCGSCRSPLVGLGSLVLLVVLDLSSVHMPVCILILCTNSFAHLSL